MPLLNDLSEPGDALSPLPKEYDRLPPEDAPLPPEFSPVPDPDPETDDADPAFTGARLPEVPSDGKTDSQSRHKTLRRLFLMPVAAAVAAVSVLFAAVGYDPLSMNLYGGSPSSSVETADAGFPSLSNRNPNGFVPGWGVLNEEYILVETVSGGTTVATDYIVAGTSYTSAGTSLTTVPGLSYDASSNTLTLNNYTGSVLNINLMGNGLKLNVTGVNSLEHLLVWGFFYGGSVTITGTGTLTVNAAGQFANGILLRGEVSQTCLMIDRNVTVDAYGSAGAVYVEDTTMAKAIYYLSPITLSGGFRGGLPSSQTGCCCFTVVDETTGLP
ncbi:MAG: hypothetical protein ILO68_04560, partial [Clostridia bacterium]|nr:hypothetical protein [Clostridia bacterium]